MTNNYISKLMKADKWQGSCQLCSKPSKRLERHHTSYRPEKTILLCHKCHYRAHYQPWTLSEQQLYRLMISRYKTETLEKWKGHLIDLYLKRSQKVSRADYLEATGQKVYKKY